MSLRISKLTQVLDKKVIIKDITESFNNGEISVISGPNGSGKTTLIKSIMSIYPIKNGSVFLDQKDIKRLSIKERARLIGYVPQFSNNDFDYSVEDIVKMGRYPYSSPLNYYSDMEPVKRAMELTEIKELGNRTLKSLSGGELQKVLLARALCVEPDYLVLDEPYSNLDISHNIEMMNLVKRVTKELNITTVMVLHDLPSIYRFSDKVILMKDGEIHYSGRTKDVITKESIKDIFNVDIDFITDNKNITHIVY